MGLLNKLTIKNLKLNKKRTIVTVIGIMLSVALITAVSTMYFSLIKTLINFETLEKGNFHVAFYDVKYDDVESIKNNRGVLDYVLTSNVGYAKIDSKNEYKPYAFIKAFTHDAMDRLSVQLIEGRFPENSDEVLIPSHLSTNGRVNLKVGDSITLDVGNRVSDGYKLDQTNPYTESSEEIINTVKKTYKVVGIIERPASNIEPYDAAGYTFITYGDENSFSGNVDMYTKYTKTAAKNYLEVTSNILGVDYKIMDKYYSGNISSEEDLNKYTEEMSKAKYRFDINGYLIILEVDPLNSNVIDGLDKVIYIVCIIIVITSVFCIKNSFDISITEKTKQYGMLRSVGATKKQIRKNVFYEATILGLFGIPLGIICGIFASYILIIVSNYLLGAMLVQNLKLVLDISFYSILLAIILGLVTIYFSAIKSAYSASRVSPIENIRNSGGIKIKTKKLKTPKFISKIFGIGGDISYKNLKRNKKKYRTTVISIIVSVSVFIALTYFMNLAFDTIKDEIKVSKYNVSVDLDIKDENIKRMVKETTLIDGIKDYSITRTYSLESKGLKYTDKLLEIGYSEDVDDIYINVSSVGDYQFKKYVESLGLNYDDVYDKGILIDYTEFYMFDKNDEEIHYKDRVYKNQKGDKITLLNDDKKLDVSIAYTTNEIPFGLDDNQYLIVSDSTFDKILDYNYAYIYYDVDDATYVLNEIEKIFGNIDYSSFNLDESVRMMKNFYLLIGIFLYGFIIVISLIGITNIFNTITTNMELRKTEFAMLKSIGMTTREFNHMIRLESIFMGSKSLIFGIPIGCCLSYFIYNSIGKSVESKFNLPFGAIIISILVVFLLITCIMKYSINRIKKQNTIETIRNENI